MSCTFYCYILLAIKLAELCLLIGSLRSYYLLIGSLRMCDPLIGSNFSKFCLLKILQLSDIVFLLPYLFINLIIFLQN